MTANSQDKAKGMESPFNINDHFNELMKSVGLDPADTGGSITFVGEDPIMESRIRLGAAYSIPYMGTAAAAAMIWKMRTGRGQDLKIDLRKAIHYITDIPWSTLNGRTYPHPFTEAAHMGKRATRPKTDAASLQSVFIRPMSGGGASFSVAPRQKTLSPRRSQSGMRSTSKSLQRARACGRDGAHVEEWANTECGQQLAQTPVIEITKIGDSKPEPFLPDAKRPLSGLRVLSNTHEIAGTAVGRTLAEQGADVLQTSTPDEFFHDHIYLEAGVGLRQAYVDIKKPAELEVMYNLLKDADVFAENFRHMGDHGLSPETVAAKRPGIIYVSAHGVTHHGAWADRGAFDPLAPDDRHCRFGGDAGRSKVSALRLVERCHQGHFWSARRLCRTHSQGKGRRQLSGTRLALPLLDVVRHPGLSRQGRHQT